MSKSTAVLPLVALILFVSVPVLAGEGRAPVWEPGTIINESGKYILTRNLTVNSGIGLILTGPVTPVDNRTNIELDLNGFTIKSLDATANVINTGFLNSVTIRNGTIRGGKNGIDLNARQIVLEDVKIDGSAQHGMVLVGQNVGVRRCEVFGTGGDGIFVDGGLSGLDPPAQGTVEDSTVKGTTGSGIALINGRAFTLRNNQLETNGGAGISLTDSGGSIIIENAIDSATNTGINVFRGTDHALSGNVVRDSGGRGIRLNQVSGSRLSGNAVAGSTDTGIEIGGDANHVEGNLLWSNGDFGLVINGDDNVYRGNTARQNTAGTCSGSGTTDFCDNGTNNSSPGDNFLPGLM